MARISAVSGFSYESIGTGMQVAMQWEQLTLANLAYPRRGGGAGDRRCSIDGNAEWGGIGRGQGQASYWRKREFSKFLQARIFGAAIAVAVCIAVEFFCHDSFTIQCGAAPRVWPRVWDAAVAPPAGRPGAAGGGGVVWLALPPDQCGGSAG